MLAKFFSNSSYIGIPNFTYSFKLESIYEKVLLEAIPEFIHGLITFPKTTKLDEEGFSQEYVTALNRCLLYNPKGIIAQREHKDFYMVGANPVKRVDIAFVSSEQGASKIKLYAVEAKRLPTGVGKREREYVKGFFDSGSPSGGIQRFKTGDHGYGLSRSALLGYVENDDFIYWYNAVNSWILDNALESPEEWSKTEQLQKIEINSTQVCSVSRSLAYRNASNDCIDLFHLWIKIPKSE
jgi:hypothetical protein